MSEMVERVADVIWHELNATAPGRDGRMKHIARAVIEALREPTGEMKDAGASSFGVGNAYIGPGPAILDGQPSKAWRAMIDAALK